MKFTWKIVVVIIVAASVILSGWFVGTEYYPAAWMKWRLGLGPEPAVGLPEAQLADEITEPPRYWIFQVEGGQHTKVAYHEGELTSILPERVEEQVEVYSNAPFDAISFPWKEWESLPQARLAIEFWRGNDWDEGDSWTMGRVPAGPAEERGYRLTWGCDEWVEEDQKVVPGYRYTTGYALRLTASEDLPVTQLHTTFRSCVPQWNPEHPHWKVLWVRKRTACENQGGFGWSGKMIQVWVVDEEGAPAQGEEVRFTTEPSFGVAYDRPDFGGLTSRFGLVEWDSLGVATRYQIWMGEDEAPLFTNVRVDLGKEYCQRGRWISWRPGCWPGFHSYEVKVQARGE